MKKALLPFLLLCQIVSAQEHVCAKIKKNSAAGMIQMQAKSAMLSPQISHELKYDVKFVHLDLNVERTNKYIVGNVKTIATVTIAPMDTFMTLLHQNHTIDSIRFNNVLVTPTRVDSIVKFKTPATLSIGATFTSVIYYKGTPPVGGSAIGSGFSNGNSPSWGNQVTWSLSESLVAYHWWPCKQILTDKIDSSWVFITTDSLNKAGSNGLLKSVVVVGNKKRYEWKSRKPIAYYLISVAVAKYKEYRLYAKPLYLPGDSILIQNYIYDGAINNANWIASQKPTLNQMPQVLEFQSKMYGMYPFYKEKYGHCMAPLGGGMEHQTMSTVGFFDYYVDAHELGHQWWGDNVTCKSWGDIWINEGFASYTEHLVAQYLDPSNFASNLNNAHLNVMGQAGGSIYFTNQDTLNSTRIFDSRLTYDKGGAIIHSLRFVTNNDSLWFNTLRSFQNTFEDKTASTVDFMNHYQSQTGINPTQFFNQWYYGQGYPTFNTKWNYTGTNCIITCTQTTSMPSATPIFITPLEYKISRAGKPDTTIRVIHTNAVETYTIPMTGTVTQIMCDPNNWLINKAIGPSRDATLGVIPDPVAIGELSFEKISVGPNPVKDYLYLINSNQAGGEVLLFNIEGKIIERRALLNSMNLDMRDYKSGVYLLKVLDNSGYVRGEYKILKH